MVRRVLAPMVVLTLFLAARPARADEVFLNDGRMIEGEASDLGDRIKVSGPLGAVYYDKSAVARIEKGKTSRQRYAEMAAVAGEDAASHFTLAQWCEDHGLAREARTELEQTLRIDPGHKEAHLRLGHIFQDGRWMTKEEYNTSRGLILYKGDWITPEERDAIEAVAEKKALEKKMRKQVDLLLGQIAGKDAGAREEAAKTLEGIPLDIRRPALREAMQHREAEVRRYAAASLGTDPQKADLDAFARMALRDSDLDNSALAFQVLSRIGEIDRQRSVFVSALGEREPLVVMRAAAALDVAGDASCVPALVAALDRTFELTSWGVRRGVISGGVTQGADGTSGHFLDREEFKSGGSMQFSAPVTGGVDPRILKDVRRSIQAALKKLTGKSFGDNLMLWHWYVDQMRATEEAARSNGAAADK